MLLTMGLSGMPSLCILGRPYNVGGLEPAGHSCRHVSSIRINPQAYNQQPQLLNIRLELTNMSPTHNYTSVGVGR